MRAWTATSWLASRFASWPASRLANWPASRFGADLEEELDMPVLTTNRVWMRSVS